MTNLASIDIGSHTARLLISRKVGPPKCFQPLVRKRAYIRLAEGFDRQGKATISLEAIDRTLQVLEEYASDIDKYNVDKIHAIATGVVREASNRDRFLDLISGRTGIKIDIISGEKEAQLTREGVLHALDIQEGPFIVFDLGGGSTEFIYGDRLNSSIKSISLGAMILTQKYFTSDPPEEKQIKALERYADEILEEAFGLRSHMEGHSTVFGTGGTVTTLAAMIHHVSIKAISHDKLNGSKLNRKGIEDLFRRMRPLTISERAGLIGLDQDRADVILAGTIVVMRILQFFGSSQMTVSMSDLLEGILIEYLRGEKDE